MPKTILIVDDDPQIQKTMGVYFQKKGFQTIAAFDGLEGAEKFFESYPDLIIADVLMPKANGAEFVKRVRGREEGAKVPIVVITSISASLRFEKEALNQWGANAFITKPFDMQDLHAKIVGYIGEGEAPVEEEPAPPTAGQAPPESERGVFADYSYGRLLKSCLDEALAGALRVRWGAAEVLLYFQDGRPVGVRSNYIPEVSLAQVLIDAGAISRSQAEEAFEHARRHGVLVGEALIDLRRIGPNKLHEALARQAKDKAILPFGFERAQYELRRGPVVGERLQTIEQPLALLALEGVVRHMKDERVRRPFAGKERRVFTFDPASRLRLEDLGLGENELAFLRAAAKGMTLEEALALRRLPPARVYQLLYTLILLGAFRFRKTERESRVAPPDPATLSPADLAVDAEANLRAGAFEKAAAIYREALARDKDLDEAWIGLGRALNSMPYEKRGGTSPEDCFVRAAEIDRRNPTPYLELARLFKQATLWRKAIDYYERALERDPANAEAQRELKLAKMRLRAEV